MIGRPQVACEILERASTLCTEDQLERVLDSLIRAARVAEDFDLLLRSIRRHRSEILHTGDATIHDDFEMLEIQAERYAGTPLPALVPRLRICVLDDTASPAHRLSAAPTLIAAYELLLDGPAAESAHSAIGRVEAGSAGDALNRLRADLQYHTFAGSNSEAIRAGRTLLDQLKSVPSELRRTRLIADTGLALFRCGDCSRGLAAMHDAYALAHDRGMAPSLLDTASMLAWMYYALGDAASMRRFDAISDALHDARPQTTSRTAHYLSNKIEFALFRGDGTVASMWLKRAAAETRKSRPPEADSSRDRLRYGLDNCREPHSLTAGYWRSLLKITHWECGGGFTTTLSKAYWIALDQAGAQTAANTMLREYVLDHRRDGFPLLPGLAQIAPGTPCKSAT